MVSRLCSLYSCDHACASSGLPTSQYAPFSVHQVEAELASVTAELVNVSSPASPASDEVAMLRKSLTKVQKSLAAAQQKARLCSEPQKLFRKIP